MVPAPAFTLRDFIRRLQRSSSSQAAALYHENYPLFEGRPDVFASIVLQLPWDRGLALCHAAKFRQNIDAEVYTAALKKIVAHNAAVASGTARPPAASWAVAVRVFSDAFGSHGRHLPPAASLLALRALENREAATRSTWLTAIGLLRLHTRYLLPRGQSNRAALLCAAAAVVASRPDKWRAAMQLLGRVQREDSRLLPAAIASAVAISRPGAGPLLRADEETSAAGPGLLRAALRAVASVTAAAPWCVALSNAMCFSYLTHAAAAFSRAGGGGEDQLSSPEAPHRRHAVLEVVCGFQEAFRRLPWAAGLRLLSHVDAALRSADYEQVVAVGPLSSDHSKQKGQRGVERQVPSTSRCLEATLHIPASGGAQTRRSAAFTALQLRSMPTTAAARHALREVLGRDAVDDAVARSPALARAFFDVALRSGGVREAVGLLPHLAGRLSPADGSRLLLLLRAARRTDDVCTIVLPFLVERRCVVSPAAVEALLECCLVHNRSLGRTTGTAAGVRAVDWRTAVSVSTQLAMPATSGSDSSARAGGVWEDHRVLSLLVKLCVEAECPAAALHVVGASRSRSANHSQQLKLSRELEALLFCLVYGRRREAQLIVSEAEKKHGADVARPLRSLLAAERALHVKGAES